MKSRILSSICVIVFSFIIIYSCTDKKGLLPNPPTPGTIPLPIISCDTITYTKNIKPLMVSDCIDCHVPGNNKGAPQYDYRIWQGLKDVGETKLRGRAILIHDMPKGNPNPDGMTAIKKAILQCWLDAGMPNN